jgi:hypothetical protein
MHPWYSVSILSRWSWTQLYFGCLQALSARIVDSFDGGRWGGEGNSRRLAKDNLALAVQ